MAEEILNGLIQNTEEPLSTVFSDPFQAFNKRFSDSFNRYFVAGMFYKNVKMDDTLALNYFQMIKNPTPEMYLERGDTFLTLQKYKEAEKDLYSAASQTEIPEIKIRAIPLLAQTYYQQELYFNAYPWFLKYFQMEKPDSKYRGPYSDVLRHLQRFDLSLDQLQTLKKERELTEDENVGLLASMIFTNNFDGANALAVHLLEQKPPLSTENKLRIGKLLLITKQPYLITPTVNELVKAPQNMNEAETIALIQLLTKAGAYQEASDIANKADSTDWKKSPDGLMALARLNLNISQMELALGFAHEASALNPYQPDALNFLIQNDPDIDFLIYTLQNLQRQLGDQPLKNPSLSVEFVNVVSKLASLPPKKELSNELITIETLHASDLLVKLIKQYPEIPKLYYLQGLLAELAKNPTGAEAGYRQALHLDPSYLDAAKRSALLAMDKKNLNSAIELIRNALIYHPNDADAWSILGNLSIKTEKWEEAISGLFQAISSALRKFKVISL